MFNIKKEVFIGSAILSTFLALDFTFKKISNSSNIPIITQAYNHTTRPFLNLEQKLERDFSMKYDGDKNETVIQNLYNNLTIINKENSALLEHTKEIKILTLKESLDMDSFGVAKDEKIILRCDYSLSDLAHEISHPKSKHLSENFKLGFLSLFPNVPTKKEGYITRWMDGTRGPKYGYISPYGSTNFFENIATYTATFYEKDYSFWQQRSKKEFNYELALNCLMNEGFITEAQKNRALQSIKD